MKKVLAIALATTMVLSLAACGEKPAASTPAPTAVQTKAPATPEPTVEPTEAPAAEPTEAPAEDPAGAATDEVTLVPVSANNLTFSIPGDFQTPTDNGGVLTFSAAGAAITVMPAVPADIGFADWTAEGAMGVFGANYANLELDTFNNELDINGMPTFMLVFSGDSSSGANYVITALGIYLDEATMQVATFTYATETENSLALSMPDVLASVTLG